MTEQIQAEFAEISTLSRQIISGDDKDDEEIIARADAVRAKAILAIEGFLNQQNLFRKHLMSPIKPDTCTHLKHLKSMVTHRLSRFSYIISFLLANSTCLPLIHFFYWPTQRVGLSLSLFFTGQLNVLAFPSFSFFYWPTQRVGLFHFHFFTGQLNVLAFYNAARWISSALITRLPTCLGNTS